MIFNTVRQLVPDSGTRHSQAASTISWRLYWQNSELIIECQPETASWYSPMGKIVVFSPAFKKVRACHFWLSNNHLLPPLKTKRSCFVAMCLCVCLKFFGEVGHSKRTYDLILVVMCITIWIQEFCKEFFIYYCDSYRQPRLKHNNTRQRYVLHPVLSGFSFCHRGNLAGKNYCSVSHTVYHTVYLVNT